MHSRVLFNPHLPGFRRGSPVLPFRPGPAVTILSGRYRLLRTIFSLQVDSTSYLLRWYLIVPVFETKKITASMACYFHPPPPEAAVTPRNGALNFACICTRVSGWNQFPMLPVVSWAGNKNLPYLRSRHRNWPCELSRPVSTRSFCSPPRRDLIPLSRFLLWFPLE